MSTSQSTHHMTLRSKKQQPKIKKSNTPKDHPKSWKPYTHCGQWSSVLLTAYSEHFQHDAWAGLIYVVGRS